MSETTTEWVHSGNDWAFLVNGIPVTKGAKVADLTIWSTVLSQEQIQALAAGISPTTMESFIVKYQPLDNLTVASPANAKRLEESIEQANEAKLAALYVEFPNCVATICDRYLDESGALLGRIRTKAAAIRALKDEP